jgi:hypothetical protein
MNRFLLIFSFILIPLVIFPQESPLVVHKKHYIPEYAFGDFSISAAPNLLCNTPNGVQLAGGLKMNYYVCSWLSFDADFVAGRDYFHFGPGIAGIPLFMLMVSGDGIDADSFGLLLLEVFIIALSAEHVAGHIPVMEVIDISPYISLLRFKYSYKYGDYNAVDYSGEQASYAVGVQVNKYYNRFYISPYAEVNVGYSDHIPRYNIGIYCGFYFPGR